MTGERLEWFKVASHLGLPVSELKARICYSEFVDWVVFLDRVELRELKEEYYLAQIAAEIRRGQVKQPRKVRVKDFLIQTELSEPTKQEKSKGVWSGALGVKTK